MKKAYFLLFILASVLVHANYALACNNYNGHYELIRGTESSDTDDLLDHYEHGSPRPVISFGCNSFDIVQTSCEDILLKKCWGTDDALQLNADGSLDTKTEERSLFAFLISFHIENINTSGRISLTMERWTEFLGNLAHHYTYSADFQRTTNNGND